MPIALDKGRLFRNPHAIRRGRSRIADSAAALWRKSAFDAASKVIYGCIPPLASLQKQCDQTDRESVSTRKSGSAA